RHRPCIDGTLEHLMQVMVYREGLPSLLKEVSEDKPVLKETMVHPAREYAFIWSPKRREENWRWSVGEKMTERRLPLFFLKQGFR
ncbi:hypothetical protein, partial [Endozoicomonas atrinae]|uniref:hypothetical protein n=1 Tax=Endozoicomonas atrinae TaxID=1333660 RepID=UPI0015865B63